MWLICALAGVFLLALINYTDEFLTRNNPVPADGNIHKRIGGLLLISTLLSIIGVCVLKVVIGDVSMAPLPLALSLLSAVPMVLMWAAYFYLLNKYPVYQVIPLFQLTAIWLLIIEAFAGSTITLMGLGAVLLLSVGAYLLDVGKIRWAIPSRLLVIMAGVTLMWGFGVYMIRQATELSSGAGAVSFWQYTAITIIGFLIISLVKPYREGFLIRVKHQGKLFLGLSVVNESLSQLAYVLGNFAIALAPVAAYASSINGAQSVFLIGLFLLFPQKKTEVNAVQIAAILMIALGIFVFELSR